MPRQRLIQVRGGTAAEWAAADAASRFLAYLEPGLDTDTGLLKFGAVGGATAFASLPGASLGGVGVPLVTGWWYGPGGTVTNAAMVDATMEAVPYVFSGSEALDRIGINVTTLIVATVIRLGIYSDLNGIPDQLLLDAGTVDSSTTGAKELVIAHTVPAGRHWLTAVAQGGGPSVTKVVEHLAIVGRSTLTPATPHCGYVTAATVSGALPATFPVSGIGGNIAKVMVRAA